MVRNVEYYRVGFSVRLGKVNEEKMILTVTRKFVWYTVTLLLLQRTGRRFGRSCHIET